MNAVEIEQSVSDLFDKPFEAGTFVPEFLESFGNKTTVIKRLQSSTSLSDIDGAVLQRSNIHLKVCPEGNVHEVFNRLKASPATSKNKVRYVLATDGVTVEAEDLSGNEPLVCDYKDFPNHFGYFLPLAGIETIKQISDSSFDIRATSRLNRLYVELLKDNPSWGAAENSHQMNHFMARLIFCFFAEDTDIFRGNRLFTTTVEQMSERDSGNTHQVISEIFRSLNTKSTDRSAEKLPRWTESFPYVNGGLFAGSVEVPIFSKIARSYLLHIGGLDWTKINPDIFGSMIQAVADDEERGALGMHYTSVPNILKVLNPLFLDDLREQLENAGDNPRTLLNLRKRISKIRVFDPACGSGNFLVIAYKQLREIENEINVRRGEVGRKSDIPLTNFRGIELRDFAAEIARLSLIIAEYQCDLLYRGQREALDEFLPLDSQNWIIHGNALKLDWLSICPPTGQGVRIVADDLFDVPVDQSEIDFVNEGGETYVCGNPPYLGGKKQSQDQKDEMKSVAAGEFNHKNLDYICAFFAKAVRLLGEFNSVAFVSTSSINQGIHVPVFWPFVVGCNVDIDFCYEPFRWSNNASNNAGVYCTILGLSKKSRKYKYIYNDIGRREVANISPYLIAGDAVIVAGRTTPLSNELSKINTGNQSADGGYLYLSNEERNSLLKKYPQAKNLIRKVSGTSEIFDGNIRWCLWINDDQLDFANSIPEIKSRIDGVREFRKNAGEVAQTLADKPHQFRYQNVAEVFGIILPQVCSEHRGYLPSLIFTPDLILNHRAHGIFHPTLIDFAVANSKLHFVWARVLSGRLGNGMSYSSNLCWNTFPLPELTNKNRADLFSSACGILLAREIHFPATIAELYEPDSMPQNLRSAHDRNDEVLERIYIGRRFKNDTERLEKLFELYTKMTGKK